MSSRLSLAIEAGLPVPAPASGHIAVFGADPEFDFASLPRENVCAIQGFFPHVQALSDRGINVSASPDGRYALSIVCLPRAKPLAHAWIWQALTSTDGPVAIDGQKTDGVDSMLKSIRARVPISEPVSKAHGKLFWFSASPESFADWEPGFTRLPNGLLTAPGCFSADGPDPASDLLGDRLPAKLGRRVVDLGSGWGYLAVRILERPDVEHLDLVEAFAPAHDCAQQNVSDPRAKCHWADALNWRPETPADAVVMNPPFHSGRSADPELGRAFLSAAARILAPHGALWMVANRHLPYEEVLDQKFAEWSEVAGNGRFKVLRAARPTRVRRHGGPG